IEEDDVGSSLQRLGNAFLSIRGLDAAITLLFERYVQQRAHVRLVFDDEDRSRFRHRYANSARWGSGRRVPTGVESSPAGSVKRKTAPPPGRFSSQIFP